MYLLIVGSLILFLFILNAIFLTIIFFTRRKMAAVGQWPSTMGTVLASQLESRRSSDGDGYVNYPAIHYSYQVGGQMYQSWKIAPGMEVGGSGAGNVVARYPAGAQVMVFYNPENPSEAVLERKAPAQWVLWLILGIFNVTLCIVIPIVLWALQQP